MIDPLAARALTANVNAWRSVARATGRELIDRDGVLTYFSMAPAPQFNPTVVYQPVSDPEAMLDEREAAYRERGIGFGIEIPVGLGDGTEKAAIDRGMWLHEEQPVMVLSPIPEFSPSQHDIVQVDESTLDEHLVAQTEGFGGSIEVARAFTPPEMLAAARLFTAYAGGKAVATSLVCVCEREAGIFGVATVPEARKRGLGRAVTAAAAAAAAESGAELAFLHASRMGAPVYEAMGFRTVGAARIYAAWEKEPKDV